MNTAGYLYDGAPHCVDCTRQHARMGRFGRAILSDNGLDANGIRTDALDRGWRPLRAATVGAQCADCGGILEMEP